MSFYQDVRFALRMIRKRPAQSAVVILTLGLGIGANGILFASFYGSALRPLPFKEPERLVALYPSRPSQGMPSRLASRAELDDWMKARDGSVFSATGAYHPRDFNFQSAEEPDRITGCAITAGLFPLLGVEPFLGRGFLPEEDRPGGPRVALVSHDVWTERFAADPRIVGRTLRLDDQVHEIVGVMPEGFHFDFYGNVWTPLQLDPAATPRDQRNLVVVARLAEGVGMEQAGSAMEAVAERLAALHPEIRDGWTPGVHGLRETWLPAGPVAKLGMVVQLVLVTCVLLIVCANVTNIVLAQAASRQHERALRAALGAGRWRLLRQTFVESALLALGGGVVGALIAAWSDVWLQSAVNVPFPYWFDLSFEAHGAAYVLAVTVMAGLAIGLLPAIKSSGRAVFGALKTGGGLEDAGSGWWRRALVVAEYAIALVVLVAGLLVVRSFDQLRRADRGYAVDKVLTLRVALTGAAYDDESARAAYLDDAVRRLGGLSAASAVGMASALPLAEGLGPGTLAVETEGVSLPEGEEPRAVHQQIGGELFEALSMPLVAGRGFRAGEVTQGADAVMVSRSLAELLWPGEDPLGRRLRTAGPEPGPWLDVIAVVGDVEPAEMLPGFATTPWHRIYLPMAGTASPSGLDAPPRTPHLVLASHGAPVALAPEVRRELRALDAAVPLFDVLGMEEVVDRFYVIPRFWSRMFSAIAFLALVIAAVGVYGVTSYSASRRLREMGIRTVLGARPAQLLGLMMRQGLVLAVVGVGLGLFMAVPLAKAMQALLYEMSAFDMVVFATVAGLLLAVGFLASWAPARRAAAADPIVALREE